MKQKQMIMIAVLVIAVGGAGFFGGMEYQKRQIPSFGNFGGMDRIGGQNGVGPRQGQGNTARMGFRPVVGEIMEIDDKSVTVKTTDGGSKIVLINDKTSIGKTSEVARADLKTGEKVSVFGTENTDGSVSAQNIQLTPSER